VIPWWLFLLLLGRHGRHGTVCPVVTQTLTLYTADGLRLEAELARPDNPEAGVVICHPHPTYGGDMHSPITTALFEAMPTAGFIALRFNFRGTGRSEGTHDDGIGERLDVAAAIEVLEEDVPVALAGWSLGADVALAIGDERVAAWIAVAAPLRIVPPEQMPAASDLRPKLLIVPEYDQFRSPESAAEVTSSWPATDRVVVPGADHFLVGQSQRVAEIVLTFWDRFRLA